MDILYRIINGFIYKNVKGKKLKIYYPSNEIVYEANLIYSELINFTEGMKSDEIVRRAGIWSFEHDVELDKVTKELERLKIELYKNFFSSQANSLRAAISKTKARYNELMSLKNSFDAYSVEGVAEYSRLAFLLERTVFYKGKKYKWKEWTLREAVFFWMSNLILETQMRELARRDDWLTIYNSAKAANTSVFGKSAADMNDDQRRLVSWTNLYTNVRQNNEAPSDEIFEDDDAFDGFILLRRQKSKTEKSQGDMESRIAPSVRGSQEIFVMAKSPEDLKRISEMNSGHANFIKDQRISQLSSGTVKYGGFEDIKERMIIEANKVDSQRKRGK